MVLLAAIRELLPGLDCGLCGLADGCQGYAQSLANGEPDLGLCLPGGSSLRSKLAELMSEARRDQPQLVAVLSCQGSIEKSRDRFRYRGIKTCRASMALSGGPKECLYGCLGFGDCIAACPYGALSRSPKGFPVVDFSKCHGCGHCAQTCPKHVFTLAPKSQQIYLACQCQAKSEGLAGRCQMGCTSCNVCIESCPYGAISWEGSLPRIDHSRCRSCSICVFKCPSKSYLDRIPIRPTAFIGLQCNGCQMCKVVCPTSCIIGRKGEHHKVMRGQCIGCGQCFEVCPIRAVTMLGALGHVNLSNF
jgi:electron transport complex protein RnfB